MKSKIILYLAPLLVLVYACKKTDTFQGPRIAQVTDFMSGNIQSYSYNEDGTISSIQKNTGGKTVFEYSDGIAVMNEIDAQGITIASTTYMLNKSGYADSSQGAYQLQNISAYYTYDANGMLTQQKNYSSKTLNITDDFTNTGKNATQIKHTNASNISTYDYYVYVNNGNTIGVQNMGKKFLGASSANLVQQNIQVNQSGDTTEIITYKYKLSGSNVDTMVAYRRNGTLKDSVAFVYY